MTVLMTDERYLGHLDGQPGFITARGAGAHTETVVCKDRFYEFLQAHELAAVPKMCPSRQDPWAVFNGGFRTQVQRSWSGVKKYLEGSLHTGSN